VRLGRIRMEFFRPSEKNIIGVRWERGETKAQSKTDNRTGDWGRGKVVPSPHARGGPSFSVEMALSRGRKKAAGTRLLPGRERDFFLACRERDPSLPFSQN